MRKTVFIFFILIISLFFFIGCNKAETEKLPLACLSLITSNDSFSLEIAETFTETMVGKGYRTKILYCENKIETQHRQIASFISDDAYLIFAQLAGDPEDYCTLLNTARDKGTRVIIMARKIMDCSDVQSLGYSFLKGVAKSELVMDFLDLRYPDAAPGSVDVLLLERLTKTGFIMTCAGMRLLSEKYIRYFDYKTLEFQHYVIDKPVYYINGAGEEKPVDEPAGGLVLDENGNAVLNPCYEPRVNLKFVSNKNITSVIDGQKAIDEYVSAKDGENLKIVMSFSGDAAVGANQRMLQHYREGRLTSDLSGLAVFGSDDTELNRTLLVESLENKSVFRGFAGYRDVSWEVNTMLEMALSSSEKKLLELEVTKASIQAADAVPVLESSSYDFWRDFDIFRDWE